MIIGSNTSNTNKYDWDKVRLDEDVNMPWLSNTPRTQTKETRSVGTLQEMSDLAEQAGKEEEDDEGIFNKVMRVANAGVALTAGTVSHFMDSEYTTWGGEISDYYSKTKGFGDILNKVKDKVGLERSDNFADKTLDFGLGLAGDIFLDPITYLSFGLAPLAKAGMKGVATGAKVLKETEAGMKLVDTLWPTVKMAEDKRIFDAVENTWKTVTEVVDKPLTTKAAQLMNTIQSENKLISLAEELEKEGMTKLAAEETADKISKVDTQNLFMQITKDGVLKQDTFDRLIEKGITRGSLEDLNNIADKLIDEGGINWFGMRLVDSQVLKDTAVGRAVKNLYENGGLRAVVEALKVPAYKAFVYGFGKNPELLKFLNHFELAKQIQTDKYAIKLGETINGLSDKELTDLMEAGFFHKMGVVEESNKRIAKYYEELNELDPDLAKRLEGMDGKALRLNEIEDTALRVRNAREIELKETVTAWHNEMMDIVKDESWVKSDKTAELTKRMDELKLKTSEAIAKLKEGGVEFAKKNGKKIDAGEYIAVTDEDQINAMNYVLGLKEEEIFTKFEHVSAKASKFTQLAKKLEEGELTAEEITALLSSGKVKASEFATALPNASKKDLDILEQLAKIRKEIIDAEESTAKLIARNEATYAKMKELIPKISSTRRTVKKEFASRTINDLTDEEVLDRYKTVFGTDKVTIPRRGKDGKITPVEVEVSPEIARREISKKYPDSMRGVPVFSSDKLNKAAQSLWGDNGIFKEMASSVGLPEEDMYKLYVPEFYKPEMQVSNFAHGSRSFTTNNAIKSKTETPTIEQFRAKGGITNFKEILGKHAQVIGQEGVKNSFFSSAIKNFGKSYEEYGKAIEYLEDGTSRVRDLTVDQANKLAEADGYKLLERKQIGGKAPLRGYVPKHLWQDMQEGLIHKELGMLTKTGIFKTFDWMTNLFKSMVTGPFPSFHAANWAGNNVNSLVGMGMTAANPEIQGIALRMARANLSDYKALDKIMPGIGNRVRKQALNAEGSLKGAGKDAVMVTTTGKEIKLHNLYKQIKREYPELFHSGQFGLEELGMSKDTLPYLINKIPTRKADGSTFIPTNMAKEFLDPNSHSWQAIRDMGSTIEAQAKLVNILGIVKNGGTVEQGIKMAEKNLFNYNKLTPFEKEVMKRLIPFYTFMSRNFAFQMKTLASKPAHVFSQFKTMNNLTASFSNAHEQDVNGLPSYLQNVMGYHIGNVGEDGHKFVTGNILPVSDAMSMFGGPDSIIGNAVRNVMERGSPLVKMPIEHATGYDMFKRRRIEEIKNPTEFTSMIAGMDNVVGNQFKKMVDYRVEHKPIVVNGQFLGYKEVVTADPNMMWFLRNLPTARLANSAAKSFNADDEVDTTNERLKFWTSINAHDIDDQKNVFMTRITKYKELGKWLESVGLLNSYTSFTKPYTEEQMTSKGMK